MDEIQTRWQVLCEPSGLVISLNSGMVAGSMATCSMVRMWAWPCMFDWPARM